MRDEDPLGVRRLVAVLAVVTLLPVPAGAAENAFTGEMVGHYSSFETFLVTPRSDGTIDRTRQTNSYWSQDYRAGFGAQLMPRTNLFAELRYSDMTYVNGSQRTTAPSGLVRLTAPIYGLTATYRPTRRVNQTSLIETGGDTSGTFTRTEQLSRNSDLSLSGYLAPARLPRLEAQWIQRQQFATGFAPAGTGTQRSLRAVQDFGRLMLQAGYADQLSRSDGTQRTLRRTWTGGATYATTFAGHNPMSVDYGFQRGENPGRGGLSRNDSHNLNTSAGFRLTNHSSVDGGGYYRHATIQDGTRTIVRDYDFYAYHRYTFSPSTGSRIGGGQRSYRDTSGVRPSPYLLASISSDGILRPRWRVRAGAAHSTNWLGGGLPSTSDAVNLGSTFDVSRTFNLHLDLQSAARMGLLQTNSGRYGTTATGGFMLVPLRSTSIGFDANLQAYGSSPFVPTSRSATESISLLWRPWSRLNMQMQRSVSGAFPNNRPQQVSTTLTAGWRPTNLLQLEGSYARSDGAAISSAEGQSGSESYGLRMMSRITRRLSSSVGIQQANRGRPSETRYFDATASYQFNL
jgi:hypothetical protein